MNWTLLKESEINSIREGREFPWAGPSPLPFILSENNNKYWLIRVKPFHNSIPAAIITSEDLKHIETWKIIKNFSSPTEMDLAFFSKENPQIPLSIFLNLLDIKQNHKTVSDWKEMGDLGENARKLYKIYEFPLNVLRLWQRLDESLSVRWLAIFQKHNIKKNIIREIVLYNYDLTAEQQKETLLYAERYSENWKNTKSPFPSEEIRDFIKNKRYPVSEKIQKNLLTLRNRLNLPAQAHLILPADLESGKLKILIEAGSYDDIISAVNAVSNSQKKENLKQMFQELNQEKSEL